ncbi:hypothetical protein GGR53DRAFT_466939 [Hypoxylon sp. FL1150]|nr:hypothetical protein GGR53DRAFT_466939 [Hypoxylon sp. FL1150]
MAETNNPLSPGSDPAVSRVTLTIAGLKTDIYGLSELPPAASKVSCLWLHHPRLRSKEGMAGIANHILSAYHQRGSSSRGLIAVAFDLRNHGSRLVDDLANGAWRDGNKTHAQDMFGSITGAVADTIHLLDSLEGYIFGAGGGAGARPDGGERHIDHNMVLGISMGGHSAWQLLFAEPRVTAGIMVIGCPDYMSLLMDRARLSNLETFTAQDNGASFVGSTDFPEALINTCKKYDPKGILFGTGSISSPPISTAHQERLRPLLDSRIAGKRFQVLSGGADKLVPYRASESFLNFFKESMATWYKDGGVYVEDNVYPGVGHTMNTAMRNDAVRFVLDTVALVESDNEATPSKI